MPATNHLTPNPLSAALDELRRQKRFSWAGLARTAGISMTYMMTLHRGSDLVRGGKPISPSVDILQKLAGALGDGSEGETERIYRELMAAAGYLQPAPCPVAGNGFDGLLAHIERPEIRRTIRELIELDRSLR